MRESKQKCGYFTVIAGNLEGLKMALTAKMRDCPRFMAWITLTAKMVANACS
jgi:hypothetical protein